ncbi:hypothetical protein EK904_014273 [Melospiza melodia maxima]|nr:hypothetical protein EK904_014273 [Melospiza melodia maxima]
MQSGYWHGTFMEQGHGAALVSQGLCAHWDSSIRGLGNIPLAWPWMFPCWTGAGRSLGIQPERDQAGYSSEVLVTGIKRNCYFDNSGLLETNKEKSLLYKMKSI